MLARISQLTHGPVAEAPDDPRLLPPDDLLDGWQPPERVLRRAPTVGAAEAYDRLAPEHIDDPEAELAMAALLRQTMSFNELTDADIARQMDRADTWRASPVTRERLVHINQLTHDFYTSRFPGSWAQDYLAERFGTDLAGHPLVQPGHAPAGWTTLVAHLRRQGVSDIEMLTAGVARTASTGRLIDQFRDRVTFPIQDDGGDILGFVARRNPAAPDDRKAGPKYLNTGETPLFHKGDQFYGTPRPGSTPVIVEGPMDAIAITLATNGRHTGLAPLGTSLTTQQAALLAGQPDVIIATDADTAGRIAAERDYWHLAAVGVDPRRAHFADGTDPADLLTTAGPRQLTAALDTAEPMAHVMVGERLTNLPSWQAIDQATQIIAARPPAEWDTDSQHIAEHADVPYETVREALARHVRSWNHNPRGAAAKTLASSSDVRRRIEAADHANRWKDVVDEIDPRLTAQPDWPLLARAIQQTHEAGYDTEKAVRLLARPGQESPRPAAELRTLLVTTLHLDDSSVTPATTSGQPRGRAATNAMRGRQPAPNAPAR